MPSLDELEARRRGEPIPPPAPPTAPEDVLSAVKAEGGRRRARRHRRNAAIAMLGLAVVALPALTLLPGDDDGDDQLTVAAESTTTDAPTTTEKDPISTTTTAATTETTVVAPPETVVGVPTPTTLRRTTTTVPRRTTTTAVPAPTMVPLVCQNSHDPACGEFRWEPAVANDSLTLSALNGPSSALVGEEVTFTVDWSDGDASDVSDHFSVDGSSIGGPCSVGPRYGPWTPPAPAPGSGTRTFRHTFTTAGTYTITADVFSGNLCSSPYSSEAHRTTTITISEPPPPEP